MVAFCKIYFLTVSLQKELKRYPKKGFEDKVIRKRLTSRLIDQLKNIFVTEACAFFNYLRLDDYYVVHNRYTLREFNFSRNLQRFFGNRLSAQITD